MPFPPVVVQIAPAEVDAEHTRALLDACTQAVRDAECVEADQAATPADANVVAIVSFVGTGSVRIEVALKKEKRWLARDVAFEETSAPLERYRAAGFVAGTLASVAYGVAPEPATQTSAAAPDDSAHSPGVDAEPAVESPPTAPSPPAASRATERDRGAPARPAPLARHSWMMEVDGVAGSAFQSGPVRGGVEGGLAVAIPATPVFVAVSGGYSRTLSRVDTVSAEWLYGTAGAAYGVELTREIGLFVRAAGLVQRFSPSIDGTNATPTTGHRVLGGARAGLDAHWWFTDALGGVFGMAGEWIAGTTDVNVARTTVATEAPFRFVLRAGLCFGLR